MAKGAIAFRILSLVQAEERDFNILHQLGSQAARPTR